MSRAMRFGWSFTGATAGLVVILACTNLETPAEPRLPAVGMSGGELVSTTFRCAGPNEARLRVWLTDSIYYETECNDGTTEPALLGLGGRDSVHVTGVAVGADCPVSPCGWMPLSQDVRLVRTVCPVSPCDDSLVGIVRFERAIP